MELGNSSQQHDPGTVQTLGVLMTEDAIQPIRVGVNLYPEDLARLLDVGEVTVSGVREDLPSDVDEFVHVSVYLVP